MTQIPDPEQANIDDPKSTRTVVGWSQIGLAHPGNVTKETPPVETKIPTVAIAQPPVQETIVKAPEPSPESAPVLRPIPVETSPEPAIPIPVQIIPSVQENPQPVVPPVSTIGQGTSTVLPVSPVAVADLVGNNNPPDSALHGLAIGFADASTTPPLSAESPLNPPTVEQPLAQPQPPVDPSQPPAPTS